MDIRRFFGGSTFKNKEKGEASSKDSKGISSSKNIKKEQEKESTSKSKENRDDNLKHKDDSEKRSLKRKHKDKIEDIVTKSKSCKKICSDDEDDRVVKAKHKKKDVLSDEDSSDDKDLKQTLKISPIRNDSVTKNITKKSKTTLTIGESSDEDNDERKFNHKSSTNNKNRNKGIKKSSSHKLFEDEESFNYDSKKHCKSENKNSSLHKKSKTKTSFLDDEEDEVFRKKKSHKNKKAKPIRLFDSDSGEEEDPLPSDIYKSKGKYQAVSDSDEESNTHIKSPSAIETLFKNQPISHNKKQKKEEDSPKLVEVSITDFFGSGPVQRSCRNTVAVKRKGAPIETKPSRCDDIDKEFHDDDFEATLKQLDESQKAKKLTGEEKKKKEKRSRTSSPKISPDKKVLEKSFKTETTPPPSESSPKKSTLKTEEDSPSLSNKLSSRFRAQRKRKKSEVTPTSSQSPCKKFEKEQSYSSPVSKSSSKEEISLSKKKSHQEQSPDIIKNTPPKDRNDKKSKALPNRAKEQAEISNSDETSDKAKRRAHFLSYKSYLNREGPQALGSREIPEGAENCMEGMTFVVTGVLESLERDQVKELIERHGGKVMQSLSKNTTYLVVGREPGPSKIDKAVKLRTKQLDEDGLIELVKTLPGKKSKYEPQNHPAKKLKESSELSSTSTEPSQATIEESSQSILSCSNSPSSVKFTDSSLLWVDKYKPQNLKQIIGQQGDKSCANKLLHWLKNWQKNNSDHTKKKQGFFYKSEDGSNFKAALLSGPPGIGKTTTATLVCQELKFSYIELNASDTRSKKSLKQEVAEALSSHTLSGFFTETSELSSLTSTKHALLMDEVDGMAGNEDRGGIQEVIALIKNTKIPIICMCNDRNHPKIRSLVNYCFDLRFQRPRIEQIKGPIMSIAFKESLKIPPPALQEIIVASNHDIRQVLHNLSVWSVKEKSLTFDQAKSNARMAKKDLKLGPFDVARKVFVGGQETAHMNIHDKSDLFFHDYSIAPLFVQENYVMVQPYAARGDIKKHLDLLSQSADSICDGDLVDKLIRTNGSWNLLPVEAIFASVVPGELMKGSITQMINFPSWLGKNSRQGKVNRILQELHLHTSLKISGSKLDLNLDYLNNLKNRLTSPLIDYETDGIDSVLDVMKEYSFIREDIDNILEIALWPGQKDPFTSVNSKVKAAFTRAYNKEIHLTPFSMSSNVKKGRRGTASNEDNDNYGVEEDQAVNLSEHEASENELENDGMIKAKKKSAAKKSKDETQNASTSKGKGRGKGKR